VINTSLDSNLSFVEFIEGISQFSVKGNKDAKLQCKDVLIWYIS